MEPKNEVSEVPEWIRFLADQVCWEQREAWERQQRAAERMLDEKWLAKALAQYNDRQNYK